MISKLQLDKVTKMSRFTSPAPKTPRSGEAILKDTPNLGLATWVKHGCLFYLNPVVLLWSNCYVCSVAQLCPTLCDLLTCSSPGFSVHGIFQARILE